MNSHEFWKSFNNLKKFLTKNFRPFSLFCQKNFAMKNLWKKRKKNWIFFSFIAWPSAGRRTNQWNKLKIFFIAWASAGRRTIDDSNLQFPWYFYHQSWQSLQVYLFFHGSGQSCNFEFGSQVKFFIFKQFFQFYFRRFSNFIEKLTKFYSNFLHFDSKIDLQYASNNGSFRHRQNAGLHIHCAKGLFEWSNCHIRQSWRNSVSRLGMWWR